MQGSSCGGRSLGWGGGEWAVEKGSECLFDYFLTPLNFNQLFVKRIRITVIYSFPFQTSTLLFFFLLLPSFHPIPFPSFFHSFLPSPPFLLFFLSSIFFLITPKFLPPYKKNEVHNIFFKNFTNFYFH
jgi:hypothetical protein